MTSYIEITDGETDPGAPGTSELWKKWWKNPIAMFEGAPGAPRLKVGALERVSPGSQVRFRNDAEVSADGGTKTVFNLELMQSGSIRVSFELKALNASATYCRAEIVRLRGGVETILATFTGTTSYVVKTADVAVVPGDTLALRIFSLSSGSTTYSKNARFMTNGEDLFPVYNATGAYEGNTYNA